MTNLESPANRQRTVPLQISRHLEEATIRVLPLSSDFQISNNNGHSEGRGRISGIMEDD